MSPSSVQRAKNWQKRVESLIAEQDFDAARSQLKVMMNWDELEMAEFVEWAENRFVEVNKLKRTDKANLEELTKTIRKCYKRHEYQQVLIFLDSIAPEDFTDKLREIQRRAENRLARIAELERKLENAKKLGDYEASVAVCEELLEIKPSHKEAGEFYERLMMKGGPPRVMRRSPQRKTSEKRSKNGWVFKTILAVGIPCLVVTLGLMFLYEKAGTIEITLNLTDSVKGPGIQVLVDGKPIEISEGSQSLNLEPGQHTFMIIKDDQILQTTPFQVVAGKQNPLVVALDANANANSASVASTHPPPVATPQPASTPQQPATPQQPTPTPQQPATPQQPTPTPQQPPAQPQQPATPQPPPPNAPATVVDQLTDGKNAGEIWQGTALNMKFCWCPAGSFTMGSDPKKDPYWEFGEDQVDVTLTKGFWLGQYEVTQGEWEKLMGTTPWKDKRLTKENPQIPVTYLLWKDAMEFCQKLTDSERKAGRLPANWEYTLPTEAQWEYSCRAGTTTQYSFGDDTKNDKRINDYAWTGLNKGTTEFESHPQPVGLKKPNPWNFYDIHGNICEFCRDFRVDKRPGGIDPFVSVKPPGNSTPYHVARGGKWSKTPWYSRSARRDISTESPEKGFRLALVQTQ